MHNVGLDSFQVWEMFCFLLKKKNGVGSLKFHYSEVLSRLWTVNKAKTLSLKEKNCEFLPHYDRVSKVQFCASLVKKKQDSTDAGEKS